MFNTVISMSDSLKHIATYAYHYSSGTASSTPTTAYYSGGDLRYMAELNGSSGNALREAIQTIRNRLGADVIDAREDFLRCAQLTGNDPLYKYAMTWLLRIISSTGSDTNLALASIKDMKYILNKMEKAWGTSSKYLATVEAVQATRRSMEEHVQEFAEDIYRIQATQLRGCSLCGKPSCMSVYLHITDPSSVVPEEIQESEETNPGEPTQTKDPAVTTTEFSLCPACFDNKMRQHIAQHVPAYIGDTFLKELSEKL
jgi:hypothetical protein